MSSPSETRSFMSDFRRNFFSGLLILIPIVVTVWVVFYLFTLLSDLGQPIVGNVITRSATPITNVEQIQDKLHAIERDVNDLKAGLDAKPTTTDNVKNSMLLFKDIIAFVLVVTMIYLLGWATNRVIGKRLLTWFDRLVEQIPLVKSIYGMMKQLLSTFQQRPDGVERVVLINFPSPEMKTVGLVMKTFLDADTGRKLCAVYVPTAPNPTSGYLELLPVEDVINTNWSVDEAMKFIVSGGAVGPETINFDKSAVKPVAAPTAIAPTPSSGA
jgi:uncharacterized membrane protein